jgi:hypothetical protein
MALPALTSYVFALDTTNVWRVCAGGLTLGLVCFLTIVWGHTPRPNTSSSMELTPTTPESAGAEAQLPQLTAAEPTPADDPSRQFDVAAVAMSPEIHPIAFRTRGADFDTHVGDQMHSIHVADVYGIGIAPDDPNIDWAHYRTLYGSGRVENVTV